MAEETLQEFIGTEVKKIQSIERRHERHRHFPVHLSPPISHLKHILFVGKALRILIITNAMVLVSAAMLAPIWAIFVQKVGGDILDVGFASAAFAITSGIMVIVAGKFSDRVGHYEWVMAAGYVIIGLGFFLYLFVNSVWFLLLVQVLIGLGEAIYNPAFDAVYSKHIDNYHHAGWDWGIWEGSAYFAQAIGAVSGAAIAAKFGFEILFIVMGLLCTASALYIFRLPRRVI